MNFKKILAVLLALAMVLSFAACGEKEEAAAQEEQSLLNEDGTPIEGYNYGYNFAYVVTWTPAEFFQNTYVMFSDELAKYGCTMELLGGTDTWDAETEINIMQNVIASGNYDAIFMLPADIEALKPVCREASEAGIPVIGYGVNASDEMANVHYNIDNYEVGKKIAQNAIDWVEAHADHFGDEVEVAIGWNYEMTEAQKRGQGETDRFNEENAKGGRQYKIVAEKQVGSYEVGMEFGENLLASNPNCEIVVGTGDDPMVGVAEAWKAAGRDTTYCGTFGMDATTAGYAAIADPTSCFRATVNQSVESQPPVVAQSLIKIVLGQLKEGDMTPPALVTVDESNIADYYTAQ